MKGGHLYVGKAGHSAVMAELIWRGYNVAMPEVDRGDDLFVVRDDSGVMWRLQVKTARQRQQKKSRRYDFKVKETAIQNPQTPELHFVFVMRYDSDWRLIVLDRSVLCAYVYDKKIGTPGPIFRRLNVILHDDGRAECSGESLVKYLAGWDAWPQLRP